jgi:hypothetical protein
LAIVIGSGWKLHGVASLRAAAESVMPRLVLAHINAAVLTIGEKGAPLENEEDGAPVWFAEAAKGRRRRPMLAHQAG